MSLVTRDKVDVTVEYLTNGEYSSSLSILTPEVSFNLWGCIDSQSIDSILLDNVFHPGFQGAPHKLVVLVEVRQVSKSTVLNLIWILPVVDLAFAMVMFLLIEWINF